VRGMAPRPLDSGGGLCLSLLTYWAATTAGVDGASCVAPVNPDACAYDMSGCTTVAAGSSCVVACNAGYTGSPAAATCPSANADPTTPATWSAGGCSVVCPNPSPMTAGYAVNGGTGALECGPGYYAAGSITKSCTVDVSCTVTPILSGCDELVACAPPLNSDPCEFDMSRCGNVLPGAQCAIACNPLNAWVGLDAYGSCPSTNTNPNFRVVVNYPSCSGGHGGEGCIASTDPAAGVWGDPITYFGDRRQEFKLPLGVLTPMLLLPDMHVFATAFQGKGNDEQWMASALVTTPAGQEVVSVEIKRNLASFNRSRLAPNAFETILVRINGSAIVQKILPRPDEFFLHWTGIHVAFARIRSASGRPVQLDEPPRREAVMVTSNYAKIMIVSSSATEYYTEDPLLSLQYSHLDLMIMDMSEPSKFRGLLPELWGIAPRSSETEALMM